MKSAKAAYDLFASAYDRRTAQNNYELWLGEVLLPELANHGLKRGWALDIGCGTGRAFDPLLDREWEVVGADVSTGMLAEAERKYGSRVRLIEADGRALPPICPAPGLSTGGAFNLVLLLNDVLNYMTDDDSLELAFASVRRNLEPDHGLAIFDINSLSLYRRGEEWHQLTKGADSENVFDALLSDTGAEVHIQQRYWAPGQIKAALVASGFRCLAALGQREEGSKILLSPEPNEERDPKVIYIVASQAANHRAKSF